MPNGTPPFSEVPAGMRSVTYGASFPSGTFPHAGPLPIRQVKGEPDVHNSTFPPESLKDPPSKPVVLGATVPNGQTEWVAAVPMPPLAPTGPRFPSGQFPDVNP